MNKSEATAQDSGAAPTLPKIVSIESLRAKRAAAAQGAAPPSRVAVERELPVSPTGPGPEAEAEAGSRTAADREALMSELRAELGDLPDVRLEKIIEAKLRISRGYYDSDRIRLDILGALLGEEGAGGPPAAGGERPARASAPATASPTASPVKKKTRTPRKTTGVSASREKKTTRTRKSRDDSAKE